MMISIDRINSEVDQEDMDAISETKEEKMGTGDSQMDMR